MSSHSRSISSASRPISTGRSTSSTTARMTRAPPGKREPTVKPIPSEPSSVRTQTNRNSRSVTRTFDHATGRGSGTTTTLVRTSVMTSIRPSIAYRLSA